MQIKIHRVLENFEKTFFRTFCTNLFVWKFFFYRTTISRLSSISLCFMHLPVSNYLFIFKLKIFTGVNVIIENVIPIPYLNVLFYRSEVIQSWETICMYKLTFILDACNASFRFSYEKILWPQQLIYFHNAFLYYDLFSVKKKKTCFVLAAQTFLLFLCVLSKQ